MDQSEAMVAEPASPVPEPASASLLPDPFPEPTDALLELLLHSVGAGVALLDRELRFVRLNAQMAAINRLSIEAHLGRAFGELLPHADPQVEASLRRVLATGQPALGIQLSGENAGEPGVTRHFVAGYHPFRVDGELRGVLAVVHETTEQRRAEDALREQTAMLQLLVENIGQTFYLDDAVGGRALYASPAYEQMFGRSVERLYADPRSFLLSVHPGDRARVEAALPRIVTGQLDLQYRLLLPDGTVRWVRDRSFPVRDGDGRVVRSAGIVEDVTLEHELFMAERLLAEAGRVLSSSLEVGPTLERTLDLLVPRLGDYGVVVLRGDDGEFAVAAWRHGDPAYAAALETSLRGWLPTADGGFVASEVLRTGQPVWRDFDDAHLTRVARDAEEVRRYRAAAPASAVGVPLAARGDVFGVLIVGMTAHTGRRHSEREYQTLREVGERASLALDNARLYAAEQHARRAAEGSAEQVRRLQALTAGLSGALTVDDVVRLVLERGLRVFGAYAGGVSVLDDDGTSLQLLGTFGYPAGMAGPFARVPLDAHLPLTDCARTGELVFAGSRAELAERYPALAGDGSASATQAWLALPLRNDGHVVGVLSLSFDRPLELGAREQAFFATVAQQCAQALERVRLYEAEQRARAAADLAGRRSAFLAETSRLLSASLDVESTLAAIAHAAVPGLGDWCAVDVVADPDAGEWPPRVRRVATAHQDPARVEWARQVAEAFPTDWNAPTGLAKVLRGGGPEFYPEITDEMLVAGARGPEHLALLREVGFSSLIIVPIPAGGRILGALMLVHTESGRHFDAEDLSMAGSLARRAGVALENARLYGAELAARAAAEDAAGRIRRLQALTAALSQAATPAQVAQAALQQGLAALDGVAGGMAVVCDDGETLEMVASEGLAPGQPEQNGWARFPIDAPNAAAEAVRTGEMIVVRSLDEWRARYPAVAPAMEALGAESAVVVPLSVENRAVGVLAYNFREPRTLSPEDEAFVTAVARQAAQALERARLFAAEHEARAAAERAAERSRRLQQVTAALSHAAAPDEVARVIVANGAAALDADAVSLAQLDPDANQFHVLAATGYPERVAHEFERFPLHPGRPLSEAVLRREAVLVESLDDGARRFPFMAGPMRESGHEAYAGVPLLAGGRVLGGLSFSWLQPRAFSPGDRAFLVTLAELAAQAMERAELYEAERRARAEAEAANLAKTEFLAVMSHELRTPLNAIAGYAELLAMGIRGPVTPAQAEDLARIQQSQRHLLGLINDVLNFARIEAGRVELNPRDVPLDEALAEVEPLVAPQVMERGLIYRYLGAEPGVVVRADPEKLRQVLLNVLSNAVKFTPPGGTVTMDAVGEPGGPVQVRVADTGIGIPADRLERIFEPFVQLGRNLSSRHEGTGLGLAISRDLARAMGGDLAARSEPGHGSTFILTLPRPGSDASAS
ncbi:MAG TPA: GAF domain-containing protein [Longimicrobium sp.]|nr:GAF domain-containing protein [Longimicrobium sp.]